jgi:hypothetical protein
VNSTIVHSYCTYTIIDDILDVAPAFNNDVQG